MLDDFNFPLPESHADDTNEQKEKQFGYSCEEVNAVFYSKKDRRNSECNVLNILNTNPTTVLCDQLITRPEKSCRLWCVGCV
jgi:hypothetical protein